ncbi:MAG: PKD domain-containing protein [Thermoproteota archaeon]
MKMRRKRARARNIYFSILLVLLMLISLILHPTIFINASPAMEDEVEQFLPNLNYPWLLKKGEEGSTCFSSSPVPCIPQIAYECDIPTAQMVLVEGGIIFSYDPDGRSGDAFALNEATGKILWRTDVYGSFYNFITVNALGKYYYVGTTGTEKNPSLLIALDKGTGRMVWRAEIDERGICRLITCDNKIYVGTRGGLVICIDENGNELWRSTLENKMVTDLAYGNGKLYVNLEWSKILYALNAENGELVWTFNGNDYLSGVAFKNNLIFVKDGSGKLIALSSNGDLVWRKEIGIQSFSLGENSIYVVNPRMLFVLDFQGGDIGRFNLPEGESFHAEYGVAVATKNIVALPIYGRNYGRLYLLWKGITPVFNLTYSGDGAISPRVSVAYGRIYAVFYTYDRNVLYKLHDIEKPVVVSAEAAEEVCEGEALAVRTTVYDDNSGIYKVLLAYSVNGGKWNYVDMELERRYVVEPVCGYGFSEEPYVGKVPAQRVGSRISWRVIAIDNVGNYIISQEHTCRVVEKRDLEPPVTRALYEDVWHNSDFTITLEATDDMSGVAETYYRINNGMIKRVSVDGYPLMTMEGFNNTLEYWSVDNAGNEEIHKFITGIKLDKSRPVANAGQDRKVNVGDTVVFDASMSTDNMEIVSYEWDFGDGGSGIGVKATHVYKKAGTYTVTLTVKDHAGNTGIHSIIITVSEAFPMLLIAVATALLLMVIILVILVLRRRR